MAQVIKTVGTDMVISSDLPQPSNVLPPELPKTTVTVQNFLENGQDNPISFVLDERFRERAIHELLQRNAHIEDVQTHRDLSSAIEVNKQMGVEDPNSTYMSVLMQHYLYRPDAISSIIKTSFTEFI